MENNSQQYRDPYKVGPVSAPSSCRKYKQSVYFKISSDYSRLRMVKERRGYSDEETRPKLFGNGVMGARIGFIKDKGLLDMLPKEM